MKCDNCQHKKRYTTGQDEYPGLTTIEYCSKKHWEDGDNEPDQNINVWDDCVDFIIKPPLTNANQNDKRR